MSNNLNNHEQNGDRKKYPNNDEPNVLLNLEEEEDISLSMYLDIILRNWILILSIIILFIAFGAYKTTQVTPRYQSTCKITIKSNTNRGTTSDFMMLSNLQALTSGKSLVANMETIKSYDTAKAAFNKLSKSEKEKGFQSQECPRDIVTADNTKDTDIINITVKSYDPKISAKMANIVANVYFEKDLANQKVFTRQASVHIKGEINNVNKELKNVRKKISDFKSETGIFIPENAAALTSAVTRSDAITTELEDTKIELGLAETRLAAINGSMGEYPDTLKNQSSLVNPIIGNIISRIDELTSEKNQLLQKFTADAPEIKKIDEQIKFEQEKLKKNQDNYIETQQSYRDNPIKDGLKQEKAQLKIKIAELHEKTEKLSQLLSNKDAMLKLLPEQQDKFMELSELYTILQSTLAQLTQQYYTLMINEETDIKSGVILSVATPSNVPFEPNMLKNIFIYLIIGAVVGFITAFIIDRLDNGIHDEQAIQRITSIPSIGRIPLVEVADGEKVQIGMDHNNQLLEPFRIFRNNILFSNSDNDSKIIAITGPDAKQGKSTISVNTAIVMALDGKKVLLVDADLRKPAIAKWFGLKNDIGYSNLVKNLCTPEEAIKESGIPNLSILTTGPLPPNPAEFLNSKNNRETVEKLKSMYDIIIYDTSPCTFISDTQIIATYIDALIMVITIKQTKKNSLRYAIDSMSKIHAPMIGYILNKLPMTKRGYYSKYYYYSSYHDDEEEGKSRRK